MSAAVSTLFCLLRCLVVTLLSALAGSLERRTLSTLYTLSRTLCFTERSLTHFEIPSEVLPCRSPAMEIPNNLKSMSRR